MKFGIRFADQIVGLVIILALVSVAVVIVMMGQAQGWFRNRDFKTEVETAGGLSKNMPVLYKGFTIGNVKDFQLKEENNRENNVEVIFTIHGDYVELAKEGSIMELQVGFISLIPSQFIFHPGIGDPLDKGATIPLKGSALANEYIRRGLATIKPSEDAIGNIMGQVNDLLATVTPLIASLTPIVEDLGEALGPGTDSTVIGEIISGVNSTLAMVNNVPLILDNTISGVINKLMGDLQPILDDIDNLLVTLNTQGGVLTMLDLDGESLNNTISSVPGLLDSVTRTTDMLPSQLPSLLAQLRTVLSTANDTLVTVMNLPIVRNGVPEKQIIQTAGPRSIQF